MNAWAVLFALYCVWKLLQAALNILLDRPPGVDPVSRGLALLLLLARVRIDPVLWSQYVSFLFVGIIVLSSTRSFMQHLMRFFHHFSSNLSYNPVILFLSYVMGAYFLASVLLIRMSLPPQYACVLAFPIRRRVAAFLLLSSFVFF